jgi:hypothetical protein
MPESVSVTAPPPPAPVATARRAGDPIPVTEREWASAVIALARLAGWQVFAVLDTRNPARRLLAGWPDLVVWRPGRGVKYRELKTATGLVEPGQQATLDSLAAAGADVAVWRPLPSVQAALEAIRDELDPPSLDGREPRRTAATRRTR